MTSYLPRIAAGILMAGLALPAFGARAEPLPQTRAEFDAYLRDYLMSNPQVLRDALLKLEREEEVNRTKTILRQHKDQIYAAGSPEIGAADAPIKIVEFYDYNCPYCRASYLKVKAFLKDHPDAKVVLKDTASFGKDSEDAARIVLAAANQKDITALHDALMTRKGKVTGAIAVETAGKLGFDVARLQKEAASSETGDRMTRTQELANTLSVVSTPLYIIGHYGIQGAPEDLAAQLAAHVAEIRKAGCDVC